MPRWSRRPIGDRDRDSEVIMIFHLHQLGDDDANDLPHFKEDDEHGSVRDETLEEEADDELLVPGESRSAGLIPDYPPPHRRTSSSRLPRSRNRGTRGRTGKPAKKPKVRPAARGKVRRPAPAGPKKKPKARHGGSKARPKKKAAARPAAAEKARKRQRRR